MRLKIATWNINSVRSHMDTVRQFDAEHAPDILCLQETKVTDELFPLEAFEAMGYKHHAIKGQKAYHGVATFSRELPLEKVTRLDWCGKEDARHVACTIADDIVLHNFYVPAGGDVPDPAKNDKFDHKLTFMTEVTDWFRKRKRRNNRFLLVGDLNVAPLETDVWSHKQLLRVVSHTPVEVEHMDRWYASHDWIDVVRRYIPPEEKVYSWWSYRSPNWEKADKGRRLDHIWATPALSDNLRHAEVIKAARGWTPASDHAPVIAELEL